MLGGSVALALKDSVPCSLWARRRETVDLARAAGIDGATPDLADALAGADLVLLSVPVGAMPGLLRQALEVGLGEGVTISDVGSVKGAVHASLGPMARDAGVDFIGGHPMAGSEQQGFAAARADLFEGSACLLTDEEGVGDPACGRLEAFWRSVGCRVQWIGASEHDRLVARISHLPHVMAAATASVAMNPPEGARFGGGGLRDTTRVAAGEVGMWSEILMENAGALTAPLREAGESLSEMLAIIERGDHEALRRWLELARDRHAAATAIREDQRDE